MCRLTVSIVRLTTLPRGEPIARLARLFAVLEKTMYSRPLIEGSLARVLLKAPGDLEHAAAAPVSRSPIALVALPWVAVLSGCLKV